MKLVTIFVTTLAMASSLGAVVAGQEGAGAKPVVPQGPPVVLDATKPHDKSLTLDIVEIVGCVANGPNKNFVLTNATEAVKGGTPSTTKEAIEAAKTKPLGSLRYTLIGASEWNPASHVGHKMAAKGLLIKDAKEMRLNVTSFQMVGETCTK